MYNVLKVGIAILIIGIGIWIVFDASPLYFLSTPSSELPADSHVFLSKVLGFASGGLILAGIILCILGIVTKQ